MHFEWDEQKNQINNAKHGVTFDLASRVFRDPFHRSELDLRYGELGRWQTVGHVGTTMLLVAHTVREREDGEEIVRIISARKATPSERRRYQDER